MRELQDSSGRALVWKLVHEMVENGEFTIEQIVKYTIEEEP